MTNVIRLKQVCQQTGLGKSTIYKLIKQGAFPPPIKLSRRASAWVVAEVEAWLEEKINGSRGDDE